MLPSSAYCNIAQVCQVGWLLLRHLGSLPPFSAAGCIPDTVSAGMTPCGSAVQESLNLHRQYLRNICSCLLVSTAVYHLTCTGHLIF